MNVLLSILIMILMLSVLTIVHEWGHFICARIFKVKVVEFSIFMGPKLWSHTSKKTGTTFSIRLFPLGGYCSFEDDKNNFESKDSLNSQKWYKRAVIFAGGVTMNFVLAWVLATLIVGSGFFTTTKLQTVNENSTAYFVGIREGDRLVKLDNITTNTGTDQSVASYGISDRNPDETVMQSEYTLTYKNGSVTKEYLVQKRIDYRKVTGTVDGEEKTSLEYDSYSYEITHKAGGRNFVYGWYVKVNSFSEDRMSANCTVTKTVDGEIVSETEETLAAEEFCTLGNSDFEVVSSKNPFVLLGRGFLEMISMIKSVYISLWWIITGKVGLSGLAGPIGLTSVVSDVVGAQAAGYLKVITLVNMAALISANLGVINALPIPGLDGSHLLFLVIELIRGGKKIPPKTQNIISYVGLALMILLAVFVAGNDIWKLIQG